MCGHPPRSRRDNNGGLLPVHANPVITRAGGDSIAELKGGATFELPLSRILELRSIRQENGAREDTEIAAAENAGFEEFA